MAMNNCWKQLRVRYLLSHLLLSVIATGFGFSNTQLGLPNQITNQTLSVMTVASLVKASLHDQNKLTKPQLQPFATQTLSSVNYPQYSLPLLVPMLGTILDWMIRAHAIRAGPNGSVIA